MPVLLIIKRTISAPPLEVANVRIIVLWVQCSTDGDKFHGFYKSWSARTRKLLCCVHVSVSLFFSLLCYGMLLVPDRRGFFPSGGALFSSIHRFTCFSFVDK